VDTSQDALDVAKQNVELNKLDLSKAEFVRDDVFKLLRKYRDQGETFDVIVMDPPKFVENKSQLQGACRGYKDINMLAIQLLNPGGILLTFSCSGLMTTDLFQKIVADAATDAGRDVQFIEQFRQAADHPVIASYPEGLYLKGFACRVM
ncbi:class I SAM-dependent methyltransferase, partial [Cronobacter sakazakii]